MIKFTPLLLLLFIVSCKPEPKPSKKKNIHNYVVVLDLSDRIIKESDQVLRDIDMINKIYSLFENRVKKNIYIQSKDQIKVVIAPQNGGNIDVNKYENLLYINMNKIPIKIRKKEEVNRKLAFENTVRELYKDAKFSNIPNHYTGSDISRYFREDIKNDLVFNDSTTNFVFVLTDGCMYVKGQSDCFSSWEEPLNKFENTNVMILETTPTYNNWDCMQTAWMNWLDKMNFDNYAILKKIPLDKVEEKIKSMIDGDLLQYNTPGKCSSQKLTIRPIETNIKSNYRQQQTEDTEIKVVVKSDSNINEPKTISVSPNVNDLLLGRINQLIETKQESIAEEILLMVEKGIIPVSVFKNEKREDMTLNSFLKRCKLGEYTIFKKIKNVHYENNKIKKFEVEK